MKTCGDCKNAGWLLTPTGLIKKNEPGYCAMGSELEDSVNKEQPHIPCLSPPSLRWKQCIWPKYDASGCPKFEAKA